MARSRKPPRRAMSTVASSCVAVPRHDELAQRSRARSPLRRSMTVRQFVEKTQGDYIRHVRTFTALGRSPDTATADDLRRFQLHQTETGARPPTINTRWRGAAVLFHRHPRPARARSRPGVRGRAAQDPGRPQHRGGRAPPRGGAGGQSTKRRWRPPMGPACRLPRSQTSRYRMSTPNGCCSGSSRERVAGTASPSCPSGCWSCSRYWSRIARPPLWLFCGRDQSLPVTTRQLNRAFHAGATWAGKPPT